MRLFLFLLRLLAGSEGSDDKLRAMGQSYLRQQHVVVGGVGENQLLVGSHQSQLLHFVGDGVVLLNPYSQHEEIFILVADHSSRVLSLQ